MTATYSRQITIYLVFLTSFLAGIVFAHSFSPRLSQVSEGWAIILAAFIVPTVGVISYSMQKWVDRKQAVLDRHFLVNVEAMEALGKLAAAEMGHISQHDAQERFVVAKLKLSVVGSDKVVKAYGRASQVFSSPHSKDAANEAIIAAMRAIRDENIGSTHLSDDQLLASSPFIR